MNIINEQLMNVMNKIIEKYRLKTYKNNKI